MLIFKQIPNYLNNFIGEYFWLVIIFTLYLAIGIFDYDLGLTVTVVLPFALMGFLSGWYFELVSGVKLPGLIRLQKGFLGSVIGASTVALFVTILINILLPSNLISQVLMSTIIAVLVVLGYVKGWVSEKEVKKLIILPLLFAAISTSTSYILKNLLTYKTKLLLIPSETVSPWTFDVATGFIFGVVLVFVLEASGQLQKRHNLLQSSFILLSTIPLGFALGYCANLFL